MDLHLQCKTQQQIADEIGLKQNTISDKIKEIMHFLQELSVNPNSEIPITYDYLAKKWHELSDFSLPLYNVWNTSKINNG